MVVVRHFVVAFRRMPILILYDGLGRLTMSWRLGSWMLQTVS